MQRQRRPSRHAVFAALCMVAASVAWSWGCSDGNQAHQVTIAVSLESGQRWRAEGLAVDGDRLCPEGTRHIVEVVDPATNEIVTVYEWSRVVDGAIMARPSVDMIVVTEHTCADGSGSFVTVERWGPDVWSIRPGIGTGAYREMTGGGSMWFAPADYTTVAPLHLYLDGTLQR